MMLSVMFVWGRQLSIKRQQCRSFGRLAALQSIPSLTLFVLHVPYQENQFALYNNTFFLCWLGRFAGKRWSWHTWHSDFMLPEGPLSKKYQDWLLIPWLGILMQYAVPPQLLTPRGLMVYSYEWVTACACVFHQPCNGLDSDGPWLTFRILGSYQTGSVGTLHMSHSRPLFSLVLP